MSQNTQYVSTVILVFVDLKECLMHLHVTISFAANTVNILNNKLNDFLCVGAFGNNSPTLLQLMIIAHLKLFCKKAFSVSTFCFTLFSVDLSRESTRWSTRWTGQVYWGNYHKLNCCWKPARKVVFKAFLLISVVFRTCASYRIKEICWSLNWKKCHSCL